MDNLWLYWNMFLKQPSRAFLCMLISASGRVARYQDKNPPKIETHLFN